jgi:tetratricopeptide (TPR) repeat protein
MIRLREQYVALMFLAAAGLFVYSNAFDAPWLQRDLDAVIHNDHLRAPGNARELLLANTAPPVGGGPAVSLSFALNHALSGEDGWSHRGLQVVSHVWCGLLLFAVARRALAGPQPTGPGQQPGFWIALVVALWWLLHPLHTQPVMSIIHRPVLLTGLFCLLTVYGIARAAASPRPAVWRALAVVSAWAGMAAGPAMLAVPVLGLLFDRALSGASITQCLRRRWCLYAGLAGGWLVFWLWAGQGDSGVSAPEPVLPAVEVSSAEYALTQTGVIVRYLKLVFWPAPLTLDLDWPVARTIGEAMPQLVVVGLLLAATCVWLWRAPLPGLAGAWFFLLLAPSSSVVPQPAPYCESRMYLPLAGVIAVVVAAGFRLGPLLCEKLRLPAAWRVAWPATVVALIAAALGAGTLLRNQVYAAERYVWQDAVAKDPANLRARLRLADAFARDRLHEEALNQYTELIGLNLDHPAVHTRIGDLYAAAADWGRAAVHYETALLRQPDRPQALNNLGRTLFNQGLTESALVHFARALEIDPENLTAHYNIAVTLTQFGKHDEALYHYHEALRLGPDLPAVWLGLAELLRQSGDVAGAILAYEQTLQLNPRSLDAMGELAWIYATHPDPQLRDATRAIQLAEQACRQTHYRGYVLLDILAAAYAEAGRFREAVQTAERALEIAAPLDAPEFVEQATRRLELYRAGQPYRDTETAPGAG